MSQKSNVSWKNVKMFFRKKSVSTFFAIFNQSFSPFISVAPNTFTCRVSFQVWKEKWNDCPLRRRNRVLFLCILNEVHRKVTPPLPAWRPRGHRSRAALVTIPNRLARSNSRFRSPNYPRTVMALFLHRRRWLVPKVLLARITRPEMGTQLHQRNW